MGPYYVKVVNAGAAPVKGKRYGNTEPRICTPPLRPLTPDTSLGYSVIEFAENVLMIMLLPWQKALLIRMLELLPDDSLRFRTVVVLVARQNGKSTLAQVLSLWFMYVYGLALVLGTAQDLDTAEEVWQGAVELVTECDDDEIPIRPDLFELVENVVRVNGKKSLVVKPPGGKTRRWKVKAANCRAGRGLSGDLVLLDELREHQSWDAWGAITKTTMARAMALILALSNAGDATSIVLRYLRKMAHAAVGDPDGINGDEAPDALLTDEDLEVMEPEAEERIEDADTLAIFEWSARPGRRVDDRDGWSEANPSLGYVNDGIALTERTLAAACRTDPEWVFRTECLCQWSEGTLNGPFPAGSWEAGRWSPSVAGEKPPQIVGNVMACVDVSHDRTTSWVSFAGWCEDGQPQVEVVAQRAGTAWVKPWLKKPKRRDRIDVITGQAKGVPVSALMKDLETDDALNVELWGGDDLPAWTGEFYDMIRAALPSDDSDPGAVPIRHLVQPALDVAAANAVFKPLGERFVVDRAKSPVDAAPLVSAIGAVGLLMRGTTAPPPKPRKVPAPASDPAPSTGRRSRRSADLATAGF